MPVFWEIVIRVAAKVTMAAALLALLWCALVRAKPAGERWESLRRYRYAHRGLHDKPDIPENSLPAFRRAAERGFGAELDVHLTRDGRLAVIHDSSLERTCGRVGKVEDFTARELRDQFRLEGTEEPIPFLEEVLPLFVGKAPLIVELKTAGGNFAALAQTTVACLDGFAGEYCVESFDPRAVRWLRRNRPDILRGQLAQNFLLDKPAGLSLSMRLAGTYLLFNWGTQPDFIAYQFSDRHNASLRLCRSLWGVQTVYWTIRSAADLHTAEQEGALPIFECFTPEETHHE